MTGFLLDPGQTLFGVVFDSFERRLTRVVIDGRPAFYGSPVSFAEQALEALGLDPNMTVGELSRLVERQVP